MNINISEIVNKVLGNKETINKVKILKSLKDILK